MTDKELLKLAYKASGYNFEMRGWVSIDYDEPQIDYIKNTWYEAGRACHELWNPLTDDNDALRLAVKLNLDVMQDNEKGDSVEVIANDHPIPTAPNEDYIGNIWASEKRGNDPYAATRRAIVRAAAEIGRNMG